MYSTKHYSRSLLAVAVALAAQSASSGAAAQDTFALEEVVVTAQKREQSIQDVPSTVNALSGDDLQEMKLFSFEDLEQLSAGLDMRRVSGRAGTIALRGVDFNPNSAASPAVDVYWNGITLGSNASGGIFQQLFDLERVEVLRGPQGALQGRTSPAGAIALHAAKADLAETGGFIKTTLGDDSVNNTQLAANLVLIPDELAVRVAAAYDRNDANGVSNVLDGNSSEVSSKAGRISVSWQPIDSFSLDVSHQYMETDSEFYFQVQGSSNLGQATPVLGKDDRKAITVQPSLLDGEYQYTTLEMNWEVAEHELTFVGGYAELESVRNFDNAGGNTKLGFDPNPLTAAVDPRIGVFRSMLNDPSVHRDRNISTSLELRFASLDNEFWNYTVGIYMGKEDGDFDAQATQVQPLGNFVPVPNSAIHFGREVRSPFSFKDKGLFVHNIFNLSEQLTAQAALRWQRRESEVNSTVHATEDVRLGGPLNFGAGDKIRPDLVPASIQALSSEKVTGSLSLQYAFDEPDLVAYINAGTSYRPGAVTVAAVNLGQNALFNEEDSWSVEAGFKGNFMDNTLRLNAAVFYQDYADYIARISRLTIRDQGNDLLRQTSITTNADARVQGVELDFETMLNENWFLAGSLSYTEAEYKGGESLPCNTNTPPAPGQFSQVCDVSGLELGNQPAISASLRSEYTIPMAENELYIRGLYKFTGSRTDTSLASNRMGAYSTTDLHFGLREPGGKWDVSVFVRNLFDKAAYESVESFYLSLPKTASTGYQIIHVSDERSFGLSANYQF